MDRRSQVKGAVPQTSVRTLAALDVPTKGWLLAMSIWVLLMAALPVHAQSAAPMMPENASAKSYGDGWACDIGYRLSGDVCAIINVPDNAYSTNRTYGRGWECLHGFQFDGSAGCVKVFVPMGGFLDSSGERWQCLRGFSKLGETCVELVVPTNAYLVDSAYGSTWVCNRGFEIKDDDCVAIEVPPNAYLNESGYGTPWTCERGFVERAGACEAVAIPANAYFDDATYGKGWKCARGFSAAGQSCDVIEIPPNAHLDRSGNRWDCDKNFQKSKGQCVLGN